MIPPYTPPPIRLSRALSRRMLRLVATSRAEATMRPRAAPEPSLLYRHLAGPDSSGDPGGVALVFSEGIFVAIWTADRSLLVAQNENGSRWSEPTRIAVESARVSGLRVDGHRRHVHACWQTGERSIRYAHSRTSGRTWESPVTLQRRARSAPERDTLDGMSALDDKVAASWGVSVLSRTVEPIEPHGPFGVFSSNAGADWRPQREPQPSDLAFINSTRILGRRRDDLMISDDDGRTWAVARRSAVRSAPREFRSVVRVWGDLVCHAWINSGGKVEFRRSDDGGRRWLPVREIRGHTVISRIAMAVHENHVAVLTIGDHVSLHTGDFAGAEFNHLTLGNVGISDSQPVAVAIGPMRTCVLWKTVERNAERLYTIAIRTGG